MSLIQIQRCKFAGCGKEIDTIHDRPRKYCQVHSIEVRMQQERLRMRKRIRHAKGKWHCVTCGADLSKKIGRIKFCTDYCMWISSLKRQHSRQMRKILELVK